MFFCRKVHVCLKVKEMMTKAAISNTQSLEDILHSYSGRRLQFAIRMGILPKPENLSKFLKGKANARVRTLVN